MGAYVYTPAEPTAQQAQPFPVINNPFLIARMDLFSQGVCGQCRWCPPFWTLTFPGKVGTDKYAGQYILRRNRYAYDGIQSEFYYQNCTWDSGAASLDFGKFKNVNPFIGDDGHGWILAFMLLQELGDIHLNWYLFTPSIFIDEFQYQSVYRFGPGKNFWRCLAPNELTRTGGLVTHGFPDAPLQMTITPFYA